MKRGGPLRRCTPLRRTALSPVSKKKHKTDAEYATVRARVHERDRGLCLICGSPAGHTHHILYRSQGGKHTEANLASLCGVCHDRVHTEGPAVWREELFELVRRSGLDTA